MGKPSTTTNQTGTSTTNQSAVPPDWFTNAWQNLLNSGNSIYGGQGGAVAGLTPDQIAASLLMNTGIQNFMMRPQVPAYDVFGMGNQWDRGPFPVSVAGIPGAGFTPQQATAQQAQPAQAQAAQLAPGEIAPFMNPYIDTALNPALARLRQQQEEVQAGIGANAAAAHSFGGSREAVQRMLADRNYRDTLANTAGNMLQQGWNTASGLASTNAGYRQQTNLTNAQLENTINALNAQLGTNVSLGNAQMANQIATVLAQLQGQIGIANAGFQNQAQQQYQNLQFQGAQNDANRFLNALQLQNQIDTGDLSSIINGANALNQLGGNQRAVEQQALDQYWQQLNLLANLLRLGNPGTIGASTTNSSQTGTSTRPFDFGSAALGTLGLLGKLGVFSDREDKTDIQKLGTDPNTGVDMYAYRYKSDPKSYPKVVGPMAQDLEAAFPGITRLIGDHRIVSEDVTDRGIPTPKYVRP